MRYPNYPQSLTLIRGTNWEIDRLVCWVFPAACVLPNCLGKTGLIGFPNRSDRFSPEGYREEFLSKRHYVKNGFGNRCRTPLVTGNVPITDQVLQISQER
jgi:hypothetical protein